MKAAEMGGKHGVEEREQCGALSFCIWASVSLRGLGLRLPVSAGRSIFGTYILEDLFVRGQSECALTFARTESEKGRGISKAIRESFGEKERRHALPINKSSLNRQRPSAGVTSKKCLGHARLRHCLDWCLRSLNNHKNVHGFSSFNNAAVMLM
jgi:hypothetical protein